MQFDRLPDYLRWANRRMLDSMEKAPPLEPRAWEIATHLLEAESLWLDRLQARPSPPISWPTLTNPANLPPMIDRNASAYEQYISHLAGQNPTITYTNTKGQSFNNTAHDILAHVFSHGAYHRGQIAPLVKRANGTPAQTDYILFVRENQ
ncbi:MAG TPA: DinB family protein [Tepidisphaeraceae bacterium]|jgi:uncharacterized damage-inducible protein DinB|nr:DinB family protein [Tepidisphaeraceae bacterium]